MRFHTASTTLLLSSEIVVQPLRCGCEITLPMPLTGLIMGDMSQTMRTWYQKKTDGGCMTF